MTSAARSTLLATLVAGVLLAVSAAVVGGYGVNREYTDLPLFARYADEVLSGRFPYRDFFLEYPPGALAALVPPLLGDPRPSLATYDTRFAAGMIAALALAAGCCAAVLARCRAPRGQAAVAVGVVALSPLLIGPIVLGRYDALPMLLTVLALLLAVRDREGWAAFALGVATAVKLYPAALLPIVAVAAYRRGARRGAIEAVGAFAGGLALVVLPFFALSPGGVVDSVHAQAGRHLQFETPLASVALLGHATVGLGIGLVSEAHSYAIGGAQGALLGSLATVLTLAGLVAVWSRAPRLVRSPDGIVLAFAATVAVVVAFSRVLSPQYLLWILPLVPLVRGLPGRLATGLLIVACLLTGWWYPDPLGEVVERLATGPIFLLAARNAALVALAAILVAAAWRAEEPA